MEDIEYCVTETDVLGSFSFPTRETTRRLTELEQEIGRIEKMIEHSSITMETPGVDLASAMRLNIYRSELIAYRKGIEYAAGGRPEFVAIAEIKA